MPTTVGRTTRIKSIPERFGRLEMLTRAGAGYKARCPAHEDRTPSLSITETGGKILLHCFAGCTTEAICAAMGIEVRDLFSKPRILAEYDYTDEAGKLLYQVVRYEPRDFLQRRPDGNGNFIWNLDGTRRVLYRLPEVIAAQSVLVCEGEKDCDAAAGWGLAATTNSSGAGKWRDEYGEALRGKHVTIIADADEPGRKHAQQVAASLHGKVESLKVVELPGSKDLSDWIAAGGTRGALLGWIETCQKWKPSAEADLPALQDMPEAVLDGWLGEVCQRRMADFPRAYAWPALVTAAGALVPRCGAIRPNLYACLVGPQGSGKSSTIDRAVAVLGIEKPVLLNVKPGSAEGLIEHYLRADGAGRLLTPDELAHLLEKAKIENASFPYILNTAFYHDAGELTASRRKRIAFNARLSLLAGVIDELFGDVFSRITTGGLYGRFVFGQCPTGFEYAYRPFAGAPESPPEGPVAVEVDPEVWSARDAHRKETGFSNRELELALRVAVVCAAFDRRPVLRAKDLGPAWSFARYQHDVRAYLKPNPGRTFEAEAAIKFLAYLERYAADGRAVRVRQLYHYTHAETYGLSIADRALAMLGLNGDVGIEKVGRARMVRLRTDADR